MDAFIDVTGTGVAIGVPDVFVLDLRVTVDGTDVAPTLEQTNRLMAAVQDAAREAGVEARRIRTTSASVGQRWAPDGSGPAGHTASQGLQVRVPTGVDVGPVLAACSKAAGNAFGLDSLSMAIDDPEPLLKKARGDAFAHAREKAEQFARLAHRPVGAVVSVSDQAGGHFSGAPTMDKRLMSAGAEMSVAPGESMVSASVAVRFAWGD